MVSYISEVIMKSLVKISWLSFLIGCSGSGGFTNGFKLGKKTEKKTESNDDRGSGEEFGKETNSGTSEDSADQPVQITGTYLTCSETTSSEIEATFGCRLARKDNGKTVNPNEVGTDWTFDYEILNGQTGSVFAKKSVTTGLFQVFYEFEASSRSALKSLIKSTRISLNIDLLPAAGVETGQPEFSGLIVTFVPAGQSEIVSGMQVELSENIVASNTDVETPDTQVVNPPAPNPNPVPPLPTAKLPDNKPETDSGLPDDSNKQPNTSEPANQSLPNETVSPATDGPLSEQDPVVTFSLQVKSPGVFALRASFDQTAGLSGATFGGGTSGVNFIGGLIGSDGAATLGLTTPVSVSVKKGTKICTGSDTIGAGKISLPLICK